MAFIRGSFGSHFQRSRFCSHKIQGRRASLRSALAPATLFRAFGAALADIRSSFGLDVPLHFKLESTRDRTPKFD